MNHVETFENYHASCCCPLLFIYKACSFCFFFYKLISQKAVTVFFILSFSGFCHCLCVWVLQSNKPEPPCVPVHRRGGHCPLPSAPLRHPDWNRPGFERPGTCKQWTLPLDDWDWWEEIECLKDTWLTFLGKISLRWKVGWNYSSRWMDRQSFSFILLFSLVMCTQSLELLFTWALMLCCFCLCHVYNTWCLNPAQLTMGSLVFEFVCVQWKIWASASSSPAGIVESDDISALIGEMETAVNYFQKVSSERCVRGAFVTWPVRDLCPRCLNN